MNKNAIQKYAIWARNELIEQVKQRAYQYGISEKGCGDENATVISGRVLKADEKQQRQSFVEKIKKSSYQQAVEEVAYTWFNRFVALRYMEVNDFLPIHVRVFSDPSGSFKPEILTNVLHVDLPGLDRTKVSDLLNTNATEELYRYLLLTQCNALNELLPEMFERMGAYTEMLLPNNILKQDSVIGRLVNDIPEEDFRDAVQIIGWMYQYYNTEPKQEVFDGLKKNSKITKEKIPAATQLFTPDWIVRYMVENSLGCLWLESRPNSKLRESWKYYLDEVKQTPEVADRLRVLRMENALKSPEDIKVIDPCMGSGHILVYAFDMLLQIYTSEGYSERDAAKLILEKNLYGLEIDRRAYQLSYFALMMKARQYNRRILTLGVRPQVYEPTGYADGMEYGSLIRVDKLEPMPEQLRDQQMTLFANNYETKLNAWNFRRLLAEKYDVVVTNPPYMGNKGLNPKLSEYLQTNYTDYKSDTFSAFIIRCGEMARSNGFVGMFSPYVWMFIQSYEKLRNNLYSTKNITTLIQFEYSAFEEATVPVCTFVYRNTKTDEKGGYFRLVNYRGGMEIQRQKYLEAIINPHCGYFFTATASKFTKIPGSPVAYWVRENILKTFENGRLLGDISRPRVGQNTGDNARFLRLWFEVSSQDITFGLTHDELKTAKYKWLPYNKGGDFKKWYGNQEYLVNWANDGEEIKAYAVIRNDGKPWSRYIQNVQFMCEPGITWTFISSSKFATRYLPVGFICDVAGSAIYPEEPYIDYLQGFLNTEICFQLLMLMNPTLNFQAGNIASLPIMEANIEEVNSLVQTNISISRTDWDLFETSWDFKRHPLISSERTIAEAFGKWECEVRKRFETIMTNEKELNRIFISTYGVQDEHMPALEDKDITVSSIFDSKDDIPETMKGSKYALTKADVIKSFISYAVGCMFGRYSLDTEGLAYAGGEWDVGKYRSFIPDKDNIIPISDDEYFDDDMAGRFVTFVKTVYGADTLEENLKFIADALDGKGTPREVIRNYFLNDFYKDHLRIYQKRPIYWQFDSGKKNGFKALIYMHRYSRDLLAKLRTDYVHEQQERYRTQLSHITSALNTASGAERAKLLKQQSKLTEQALEIGKYEEKVHHLADQNITIDLDDGVKNNYEIFADVLAKI